MAYKINSYEFGTVVIGGKSFGRDVIVYPDRIRTNWRRKEGHRLLPEDIWDVLEFKPDILVVGTGMSSAMSVPEETVNAVEEAGIYLRILPTPRAVKRYNSIRLKKRTVAALHLTC